MTKRNKPTLSESDTADDTADEKDADTFFVRWARRKSGIESDAAEADQEDRESPDGPGDETDGPGARSQKTAGEQAQLSMKSPMESPAGAQTAHADAEEEKGDEDMPSLDTIDQGGSVADFFSSKVSPALRQAALRRLFGQSALPVTDDLDDYAEDFTKFTRLGDIVTSDMRYRMEVARKRLLERNSEDDPAESVAEGDPDALASSPDVSESPAEAKSTDAVPESSPEGGESFAKTDSQRHVDDDAPPDESSTKESSRHEPDPG
ncbi:MAG TPA: DUF3306 domain-containing protein [Wenzhouxiangellaceae bacterium]|nr:DUF3306 domain-containing protein [Wenzhouxiangellaceae bacterium]